MITQTHGDLATPVVGFHITLVTSKKHHTRDLATFTTVFHIPGPLLSLLLPRFAGSPSNGLYYLYICRGAAAAAVRSRDHSSRGESTLPGHHRQIRARRHGDAVRAGLPPRAPPRPLGPRGRLRPAPPQRRQGPLAKRGGARQGERLHPEDGEGAAGEAQEEARAGEGQRRQDQARRRRQEARGV